MDRSHHATLVDDLRGLVDAGLPGVFTYIEDPDGCATFLTAGVADLESGRRMTPDSHYRIGSTTKTFTAVVVLQLFAEGRLALDDPVSRWTPDRVVPHGDALTIEHLLRMRSGLADFVDHPSLIDLDANRRPHTLEEVLDLGLAREPNFEPGARSAYCNTNFCLLEAIVEQVTARPFAREITERIIGPLDLRSTSYPPEDDLSLPEPYIRGYDHADERWRECSEVFYGRGDGAIISTALDVSRFLRGLFAGRLVPRELLAEMRTVIEDDPPPRYSYGMGLIADPVADITVWGHSGGGWGYRHLPFIDLETGRLVICMQNGTYGFPVPSIPPERQPRFTPEMRRRAYAQMSI